MKMPYPIIVTGRPAAAGVRFSHVLLALAFGSGASAAAWVITWVFCEYQRFLP